MERLVRTAPRSAHARSSAVARPQSGWPQVTPAWGGFLSDAAQLSRDSVVFVGLAGCLVLVLLALAGGG